MKPMFSASPMVKNADGDGMIAVFIADAAATPFIYKVYRELLLVTARWYHVFTTGENGAKGKNCGPSVGLLI